MLSGAANEDEVSRLATIMAGSTRVVSSPPRRPACSRAPATKRNANDISCLVSLCPPASVAHPPHSCEMEKCRWPLPKEAKHCDCRSCVWCESTRRSDTARISDVSEHGSGFVSVTHRSAFRCRQPELPVARRRGERRRHHTIYFSPTQPAGVKRGNWIQTESGQRLVHDPASLSPANHSSKPGGRAKSNWLLRQYRSTILPNLGHGTLAETQPVPCLHWHLWNADCMSDVRFQG